MNIFVLFCLTLIFLFIFLLIQISKKYNDMLNEKFNYLKIKINNLESKINSIKIVKNGKK
jgi:hypothetical protein